jgi:hypothetical protein
VTLGSHAVLGPQPSPEPPTNLVVMWLPRVVQGVDTAHNGQMMMGLAGRLMLVGADGLPLVGDGDLTVELYVDPPAPGAPPRKMEDWHISHDDLHHKCLKRDMVGWGYNLQLPWNTFRPEITHVLMRATYKPVKGQALYTPLQPVTLSDDNQTVVHPPTTLTGAAAAQAAAAAAAHQPVAQAPAAQPPRTGPMTNLPTFRPGPSTAPGATP